MADHRSASLPECGHTEYPAPEPCFICDITALKNHSFMRVVFFFANTLNWYRIYYFCNVYKIVTSIDKK